MFRPEQVRPQRTQLRVLLKPLIRTLQTAVHGLHNAGLPVPPPVHPADPGEVQHRFHILDRVRSFTHVFRGVIEVRFHPIVLTGTPMQTHPDPACFHPVGLILDDLIRDLERPLVFSAEKQELSKIGSNPLHRRCRCVLNRDLIQVVTCPSYAFPILARDTKCAQERSDHIRFGLSSLLRNPFGQLVDHAGVLAFADLFVQLLRIRSG